MNDRQTAAVIIPTTGRETLRRAVESVLAQTHADTVAVVVVDGSKFSVDAIERLRGMMSNPRVQLLPLPQNTGANGYQGHRIYGAVPLLLNQDWIFYLDDDNWYEPDHVAECIGACVANGLSWCATLRNIVDADGKFVCVDECESLAVLPTWFNPAMHHVDTSCYCLSREVAVQLSMHWHRPHLPYDTDPDKSVSPDAQICNVLRQDVPRFALIARPTVNYTLGSRDITPTREFFLDGNTATRKRLGGKMPWQEWLKTTEAVGWNSSVSRWHECRASIDSFHRFHGADDLAYYMLFLDDPADLGKIDVPEFVRGITWHDFDPKYQARTKDGGLGWPRCLLTRYMQDRHERCIFLDGDTFSYTRFADQIFDTLKMSTAVVTPHRLKPVPRDGKRLAMEHFALFGNYNSGFFGFTNHDESKAFVDWWLAISVDAPEQAPASGRYAEQGWLRFVGDLLPDALILRDPGINAAWWRIDSPEQVKCVDGQWTIDGRPLKLFHFSQIDYDNVEAITVHQERIRGTGDLLRLYEEYRDAVKNRSRSIVPGETPGTEHADADARTSTP